MAESTICSPTIAYISENQGQGLSYLVLNGPFAYIVKVLALVLGVEIRERRGALLIEPDLAEYPGVGIAHQSLADRVQAMRCERSSVWVRGFG